MTKKSPGKGKSKPSAKPPRAAARPSRASSRKPEASDAGHSTASSPSTSPSVKRRSGARAVAVLPRPIGLPLTPEEITAVERMAGNGLTSNMIAATLGLSVDALKMRAGGDVELARALERGKARCFNDVGQALVDQAKGGNVLAIRWYEATRRGLSEKVTVDHTGDLTVTVGVMSPEERRKMIAKYQAKVEKLRASPHTEKPPREITEDDA